jgi:hypothetical protein
MPAFDACRGGGTDAARSRAPRRAVRVTRRHSRALTVLPTHRCDDGGPRCSTGVAPFLMTVTR